MNDDDAAERRAEDGTGADERPAEMARTDVGGHDDGGMADIGGHDDERANTDTGGEDATTPGATRSARYHGGLVAVLLVGAVGVLTGNDGLLLLALVPLAYVAYGTVGLKTHTKTALVVRQEADGVTLYSHVGTGNYHSETAKGYVDLGILTADRDIGQDLVKVFNFFTGPSLDEEYRKLLIAPETMRETFTDLIRREAEHARAGRGGRLVVKVNGLEDPEIVAELYRASMAGVEIDLFVRDICRLRPGVDGLSENITVHSIVGRFLEHSRIFYFENDGDPEWYIGSADWMTRNLDHRVEAVAPVESTTIRRQLRFIFSVMFADNRRRWVMEPDGSYEQVQPDGDEPIRDT